jgi:hypothetical protein
MRAAPSSSVGRLADSGINSRYGETFPVAIGAGATGAPRLGCSAVKSGRTISAPPNAAGRNSGMRGAKGAACR